MADVSAPHADGTDTNGFTTQTIARSSDVVYDADAQAATPAQSTENLLPTRQVSGRRRSTLKHAPMTKPIRTCFILAMPWAAYSVLNTVFEDVRQPYMSSMGIGDFIPRFVPALVAFFLGPILGAASDRSLSKWGRRNVFLVSAAIILTISGLLFGSAQMLFSTYVGLTNTLFFMLAIGLVLLNIGLRARLMDEVSLEYQVHAQAAVAFWAGFGSVLGSLLFRRTAVVVFVTDISGEDILISFSAALAGIILTTAACIYLRPEHPQDRPPFQPPLARLVREALDQIVYAPRLFRILCLVYFVQYFAWSGFRDEVYNWWARNVYDGCNSAGCDARKQEDYRDGLDTANIALISQNGLQLVVCLILPCAIPRGNKFKRVAITGLCLGAVGLIVAVSVGGAWIPLTFGAFVVVAFYQMVTTIFPYSVVGIMGKEIQESQHGFNNNGLYIGVLTSFSAASQLFVQLYGTEHMSPLGTGNVMFLSCILFVVGPGAYMIPSTFRRAALNEAMRQIHREEYGREFARQQRRSSDPAHCDNEFEESTDQRFEKEDEDPDQTEEQADKYRARRERLRDLLQAFYERPGQDQTFVESPVRSEHPLSPSLSATSNYDAFVEGYRHQSASHSIAGEESLRSPARSSWDPQELLIHTRHLQPATQKPGASAMTPLSYETYLSSTSYSRRLTKLQSRKKPLVRASQCQLKKHSRPSSC
ncbi:hypothetical protein Poli38472_011084 [Pythium oligandrum]|uniref:Uncharacterized protein n=1 Tax=Pythium oligandrum TaxID=41045 RepID=A0A8K1CPY4_PYTOL|nr:hypothetical protein Poli38472_011084 [Pythium oligandrum]|eukprot:TMW67464.1 hypothetical protein Poli38472_011084 [Pythium oligandrum]